MDGRYRTFAQGLPQDAGKGSGSATRVEASALIPVGGINFAKMQSYEELLSAEMDPRAGWHRSALARLKASGKHTGASEDGSVDGSNTVLHLPAGSPSRQPRSQRFSTGARVRDNKMGKKGTVIQASAGHTKKSKTPVHRVADRHGNTWLAKQTDLTLLL